MFGKPIAVVAQAVGQARQLQRVAKRVARGGTGGDGRLIEDTQSKGHVVGCLPIADGSR